MENIKALLKALSEDKLVDKFYFVGGTALGFLLDHRISYDIDFMSDKKLDQDLLNTLIIKYNARFIPDPYESVFRINTGNDLRDYKMQFMIDSIKVKFFYPNDKVRLEILEKHKANSNRFLGIKRASLDALAELKLVALFDRKKIRDLFDVFYLFYKKIISCDDIDRFLSLRYSKTFVEFIDELNDEVESLDFLPHQEFSYIADNKLNEIKKLFKSEYIKRCI